jgi:hydrogenase-4 component B
MAFLALVSFSLGVLPTFVIPTINRVVEPLVGSSATTALVPPFFKNQIVLDKLPKDFVKAFGNLGAQIGQDEISARGLVIMHRGGKKNPVVFAMSPSYMLITLFVLLSLCYGLVWLLFARKRKVSYRPRWDGGVRRFLPEMTYTATGFAQPVRVLFNAILRPNVTNHQETIAKHFRVKIQQERKEVHLVDRLILYPLTNFAKQISFFLAKMHNGRLNSYTGYALLTLIIFLSIISFLNF